MSEATYLLFVWTPNGYELREQQGELPEAGAEIEVGEQRLRVAKIAPSPLPGDPRVCAYVML